MKLIFTRYLYLKDEVEISLLMSILNKTIDSLFWSFELYFSGFENELFELFFKVYYEFYALTNPSFEKFLVKNFANFCKGSSEEKKCIVVEVINNFMIRKHTLDVFMLRQVISNFQIDLDGDLEMWLENRSYEKIACFILEIAKEDNLTELLIKFIDYFLKKGVKLKRAKILSYFKSNPYVNYRIILLSKIMHFYALFSCLKMGKKLFISADQEDTSIYETIYNGELTTFRPYKILPIACIYGTNDHSCLSLFKLRRDDYEIKKEYYFNWEYHAYSCPIWKTRFEKYGGVLDHENKNVKFADDELFEDFYDEYSYEPDEQKISIKEKNIPTIVFDKTCKNFYETYKNFDLYVVDDEYFNELDKFVL